MKIPNIFKRLAHIIAGALTSIIIHLEPASGYALLILYIIYEILEYIAEHDKIYRDLLEYTIAFYITELLILIN